MIVNGRSEDKPGQPLVLNLEALFIDQVPSGVAEPPSNDNPMRRSRMLPEDSDPLFDPFPEDDGIGREPTVVYGPDGSEYIHPADLPDERERPRGFRLGPMVFVPDAQGDPWAPEGRAAVLALYWSLYLMVAAFDDLRGAPVGMPSRAVHLRLPGDGLPRGHRRACCSR